METNYPWPFPINPGPEPKGPPIVNRSVVNG